MECNNNKKKNLLKKKLKNWNQWKRMTKFTL